MRVDDLIKIAAENHWKEGLIEEISVGESLYKLLVKKVTPRIPKKEYKYVGELYGVRIVSDPDLKPNEYKIKSKENL